VAQTTLYDLYDPELAASYHYDDLAIVERAGKHVYEGKMRYADGTNRDVTFYKAAYRGPDGKVAGMVGVILDITDRKRVEEERARLSSAMEQAAELVSIIDLEGRIMYANPAFVKAVGYGGKDSAEQNINLLRSDQHDKAFYDDIERTISQGQVWSGRIVAKRKDATQFHAEATISPLRDTEGRIESYVALARDVTQEVAMQAQLQQAAKMEAVGQLAAGIAHEINTPMQYIGDNLQFLQNALGDIVGLLEKYDTLNASAKEAGRDREATQTIDALKEEIELDFLTEEIPTAIEQSLDGVAGVAKIVRAMREFSHPGVVEKTPTNINDAIETIITLSRNAWKYTANLQTDLAPDMPLVPCLPGEINQVLLNLIVNAAHAIEETNGPDNAEKGAITIRTSWHDECAEIRISDTGAGIPPDVQSKVFNPFFTTKEVGKGTGQGLAISYTVVVEKHKGTISFKTEPGKGTTFIIRLPLDAGVPAAPAPVLSAG